MTLPRTCFLVFALFCGGAYAQGAGDALPPEFRELGVTRDMLDLPSEGAMRQALADYPRMAELQDGWEERMFAVDGVTGMGLGLEEGAPAYIVFTDRADIEPGRIPDEIDGIPVRVEVRGAPRVLHGAPSCTPPCHADEAPLPLQMGNSARWFQGSGGCTAGFKACDRGSGRLVFVTNSHCAQFANGCAFAPLGEAVISPADGDSPPGTPQREVGRIAGHAAPSCTTPANLTDATKVDSTDQETSTIHRDIGRQSFAFDLGQPGIPFLPGEIVQYSGRSSGLNVGRVIAVNVTVDVPATGGFCCGPLRMVRQVLFDPIAGPVRDGDSGSGVLLTGVPLPPPDVIQQFPMLAQRRHAVAGLLWGVDQAGGYFNTISTVLDALNLTLDLEACGG